MEATLNHLKIRHNFSKKGGKRGQNGASTFSLFKTPHQSERAKGRETKGGEREMGEGEWEKRRGRRKGMKRREEGRASSYTMTV